MIDVSMWPAEVTSTPELGLELPPVEAWPNYAEFTEGQLHDAFVEQFERILPNESEEPRPGHEQVASRSVDIGSDGNGRWARPLHSIYLRADYDIGAGFRTKYSPPKPHRRERKLSVSRGLVLVQEGVDEPVDLSPITFTAGEFYSDGRFTNLRGRAQSTPSVSYGNDHYRSLDPHGSLDMREEAGKRSFGLGIEILKIVAADQ